MQTEHVRSPPFKHLELHSPTRSVYLEAPKNIDIKSKGGDIFVKSKFAASFTSNEVCLTTFCLKKEHLEYIGKRLIIISNITCILLYGEHSFRRIVQSDWSI